MDTKITISEAVGLTGVSESTIRRDIKSGKISSEKDAKGHRRIDIAELQRVYNFKPPVDDRQKMIALLENQITDLKKQLQLSNERETTLQSEKSKLLDLLTAEKSEKRALMPPPEEDPSEQHRKSSNYLRRLIGV